jgi:amino-acid N-acetyltransferase
MTATAIAHLRPHLAVMPSSSFIMRTATRSDAAAIHALITRYREAGRLLPRSEDEIVRHADRFLVILDGDSVMGCAELAPLSARVAEVRSLVLDESLRGLGLGRLLVEQLTREARLGGFTVICAFTHEPGIFVRLGFSLVPHAWLPEKIGADCASCALFRRCGQSAMRLDLTVQTSATRLEACA